MILCDTREQKNDHILRYFEQNDIPFRVQKLDTGDYMMEGCSSLSIDRKQNLTELCSNLYSSKDKGRFWRELRRSKDEHLKLIFLIEDNEVQRLDDVKRWRSRFSRVPGFVLYNEICRCSIAYGVEFLFCDKKNSGKRIMELLGEFSHE